jgi:hypothetical protein
MPQRLVYALIFLFFINKVKAQQINSTVVDFTTKMPVANAVVLSGASAAFTSSTGGFIIKYTKATDTIKITHVGYKPYNLSVTGLIPAIIYMQPDNILISEIFIKRSRNYKLDSLAMRRDFAKIFSYKSPGIKDIFITHSPYEKNNRPNNTSELVTINLLQVVSLFSKQKTSTTRLQKLVLNDEEDAYVYRMFSKQKIEEITKLKGDSLQDFILKYKPSVQQAKSMTAYDMVNYIKKNYTVFISETLNKH